MKWRDSGQLQRDFGETSQEIVAYGDEKDNGPASTGKFRELGLQFLPFFHKVG